MSLRIGVDLGGTKIEAIALAADGGERFRRRIETPRGSYDGTLRAIADLVSAVERATGERGTVGIGMPGAVSPATGLVKNANSTWLIGHPLQPDLERVGRCAWPTTRTASRCRRRATARARGRAWCSA